ncbi:MAG: FAD-dependent oxidoreductase [Sulfuritalea sp.]|nr:FAD-dependent oxidoreductase [Sulfuritalea sp.]
MAQVHEIAVPEVGSKEALAVAEILVKPGDLVWADDPLLTIESGKAAVDVAAPVDGTITEIRVAIGDNATPGMIVAVMTASREQRPKRQATDAAASSAPRHFSLFAAFSAASQADTPPQELTCELLVLGAGPGGYSAAFRAADLGLDTILVERYPIMGGVCLNVGCIPSKALLHLTIAMEEAAGMAATGIDFAPPRIDLDKLRAHKAKVVGKLTGGLAGMAKARKVRTLFGTGRFRDAHSVEVDLPESAGRGMGARQIIHFKKCIVAAGSQPVHLPFLPRDERIVDSTGALELRFLPRRMLVIGGGIIGLEMATVYSALGARIDVVEMQDVLMPGPDRDLVKIWEEQNRHRFDKVMLRTRTVTAHAADDGVWVRFEGEMAPAEAQCYDMILQSVGRKPNGTRIDAHKAGVVVGADGFIAVNTRMATNVPHIFAIGKAIHHPHPTLGETIGMAAHVAHGTCTDLPAMQRKRA